MSFITGVAYARTGVTEERAREGRQINWGEVRAWSSLSIAVVGGFFGILGYCSSHRDADVTARLAIREELTAAWNKLGGAEGTTRLAISGVRPSERDVAIALNHIENALERDDEHAEARWMRGVCYQYSGRYDAAIEEYKAATALDRKLWRAFNSLGGLYFETGKMALARAEFAKAVALNPDSGVLHYNLGLTYERLGELNQAAAAFDVAVVNAPYFVQGLQALAGTLEKLDKPAEAKAVRSRIESLQESRQAPIARSTVETKAAEQPAAQTAADTTTQTLQLFHEGPFHTTAMDTSTGGLDTATDTTETWTNTST